MKISFVGDWSPEKKVAGNNVELSTGIVVANLECAFADGMVSSEKAYSSILPRSCMANIPSGGFAALSMANNHVNDAGNFRETYAELTCRFPDIQFFGTHERPYAEFNEMGNLVFVIGCLESCRSRGDFIFKQEDVTCLIRQLRKSYSSASNAQTSIFVYPHWGKEGEYTRYPAPWQLRLAREWIDAGADGVVGNHSHVPQGFEYYQGKPIYYSLGNFDFPGGVSEKIPASSERMVVQCLEGTWSESYDPTEARIAVEEASGLFKYPWTTWSWAKCVGPTYIRLNMDSWRTRLRKNLMRALPKFIIWSILPRTLMFRFASLFVKEGDK